MDTSQYRKPNILFLRGVTLDDIKAANEALERKWALETGPTVVYQPNPDKFRGVDTWPHTTNLKCWRCDCTFASMPWFVPTDMYRDRDGSLVMDTHGVFCTPNCTQAYIEEKFRVEPSRYDKERYLKILVQLVTGKRVDKIVPSPDRTVMEQYRGSGGITYREYRDRINELSMEYELVGYKIEHMTFGSRVV